MRESEIERHLVWHVVRMGGVAYKFKSANHRGVADRVVCLPDGQTWFVELKTKGGRLSALQKMFMSDMTLLKQSYACLWTVEQVDEWIKSAT